MTDHWLWTLIGLAAAGLTSTSLIPQFIIRIRHPQKARLSYVSLLTFFLGASLWLLYGIHLKDGIIILANLLMLICLLAIGLLQFYQENIKGIANGAPRA